MLTLERARELLATTTTEEHLILHAKNVSAAMGGLAAHFGEDVERCRVFLAQFVPVLGSILAASGQAGTAAVYTTV
mgnify:CR=1 FL=1